MSDRFYSEQKRKVRGNKIRHLYAAIEHRVIDSSTFANLKPNSVRLLLIITRQLTSDNNGWLQATWSYCRKRGFGSENTLRDAIKDLIAHQLIYRTRSRGPKGKCAFYAVTWLSIKRKEGLFLFGFVKDGFQHWQPSKKPPQKKCSTNTQFIDG